MFPWGSFVFFGYHRVLKVFWGCKWITKCVIAVVGFGGFVVGFRGGVGEVREKLKSSESRHVLPLYGLNRVSWWLCGRGVGVWRIKN